jgi:hypothetical protein
MDVFREAIGLVMRSGGAVDGPTARGIELGERRSEAAVGADDQDIGHIADERCGCCQTMLAGWECIRCSVRVDCLPAGDFLSQADVIGADNHDCCGRREGLAGETQLLMSVGYMRHNRLLWDDIYSRNGSSGVYSGWSGLCFVPRD